MSGGPNPKTFADAWDLRSPERQLLLWSLFCVLLGFFMVVGAGNAGPGQIAAGDFLPLAIYAVSLLILHLILVAVRFQGDQILPAVAAFLSGIGLLAQYRMGAFDAAGVLSLALYIFPAGVVLMLAVTGSCMRGRYHLLAAGIWVWAALSLVLVVVLLATGQRYRGAVYSVGFLTPTEILKVIVVLFLAAFIDRHGKALSDWGKGFPVPPLRALWPLIAFWVLLTGLLLLQRDLGLSVILSMALLVMLVVGTGRIGYLVLAVLGAGGFGYLVFNFFLHGQRRIQTWQAPFDDPTGNSWQILQGLSGMYSGGLWGEGFGQGNPEYTPIAESDFIYSVIGEELGFVGCLVLVVFFLVFFNRSLRIAYQTRSSYGTLVCAGLTAVTATQTFLNIGGVTKFIPLTGVTLPFISQGGSSLMTGFASLGLILAISEGEAAKTRRKRAPRKAGSPRKATSRKASPAQEGRPP